MSPHRRPGAGRDPYAVTEVALLDGYRLSLNNAHSWLWAPAYAGATRGGTGNYFVLPSLSYCEMYAQRSFASFSFLMPANAILVPGILAFGSLMYSRKVSLFQVMPDFLLASV